MHACSPLLLSDSSFQRILCRAKVGRNIVTFLKNMMTKEGALNIDATDEITRDSLVVRDGEIVNARVQELLGAAVQSNS